MDTWSPVGGLVWGVLGDKGLLEDILAGGLGWALSVCTLTPHPVVLSSPCLHLKMEDLCFLLLLPRCPAMTGFYFSENISPDKAFIGCLGYGVLS